MMPSAIDIDLLRIFALVCRLRNLSRAAEASGRTQSAVSMQIRRLEDLLGRKLFRRTGRGVAPTPDGEMFLGYATRILALGDEAAMRLRGPALSGAVRVGLPEEIAHAALPAALGRFRRAHPGVALDVLVENTAALEPLWRRGSLDVLIATPSGVRDDALATWSVGLRWVCGVDHIPETGRPLDIVVFAEPCTWRRRMFEALAESRLDYQIIFTSPSVAAVQAAVENGLGIGLLTPERIRPASMLPIASSLGLPEPIIIQYGLYARASRTPAVDAAADILLDSLPK